MLFRSFFLFLLFCSPFLLAGQTAFTVESIPDPKAGGGQGYVSDPDGILSQEEVTTINQVIAALENSSTAQVAVVIVNSIGQENPKDFATRLFQHWGIGQADVDNGLLIFTVMDQRRTEFETGYGLEAVLPDAVCYRIGMQELVPYFREGQYGPGLIAALIRIRDTLENPEALEEIRSTSRQPVGSPGSLLGLPAWLEWYILINVLFHLGLLVWVLLTLYSRQELYDKYIDIRRAKLFIFIILFPFPYLPVYFLLKRLLKNLRNQPRFSRINGKPMHKLSEKEDDEFLEKGQITEEELGAVDYDVWVTDDLDDVLILRYSTRFSKYSACPKCKYKTYSVIRTRVISRATYHSSGKREVVHGCKNCGYQKVTYQTIPRKQRSSSGGGFSTGGGGGGSSWGGGSSGGGGSGVSW